MILEAIFQEKIRKDQYPKAVYLYWCLLHFHEKESDSYIRVDFKSGKKSLESFVLMLDDEGITFSSEGNLYTENGHEAYSNQYGQINREDKGSGINEFLQKFDGWFSTALQILQQNKPYLDFEYYGEYRRDIDFRYPEDKEQDFEESEQYPQTENSHEEFTNISGTWIFKYGNENALRFLLGKKGRNPLFVIGLNPSTADHLKLDPTAQSINRIALNSGFDSWVILNLYPIRSTDPYELPDSIDSTIHEQNLNSIKEIFQISGNPVIWAAWGNRIEIRPYLLQCLRDIYRVSSDFSCSWLSFGEITQKGHPRHPLYMNSEMDPKTFEIEEYLFG